MSYLLYFLPRPTEQHVHDIQEVIDAGVTWIESDSECTGTYTVSGPGEVAGAIVAVGRKDVVLPSAIKYEREHQRWIWHPSKKFAIGVDKRNKPGPDELRRDSVLSGTPVRLLDKADWIVPVCVPKYVASMNGQTLPMTYDIADDGRTIMRVDSDYEPIAERVYAYFEQYIGADKERLAPEVLIQLACDLLSLNYQVDRTIVVGLLNLLGTKTWALPLRAAVEADQIDAYVKAQVEAVEKKETEGVSDSGGSAMNSGSTDAPTPTTLASATSR